MSNKQEITIIIDPKGHATIETAGFKGNECYDITKALKLGEVQKDTKKDEYYEKIPRVRRVNVGR
jgi:hypothetical protein